MGNFTFSQISQRNLQGVHPDLVRVVYLALKLSEVDFRVIEGLRDSARQRQMVLNGNSQTLNSRHLTGHAVDLAPWINNTIPWNDWGAFAQVAVAMKQAAKQLQIPMIWGGDWTTLKDGPHFELPRTQYP
ncbi:M15 family metallopeptidase [Yersinia nurmii]|uniref:M15 family metallopeptidase n=1 Tax=Yersinia nurmii TaxID=685706 RepID=A0AAW7KB61_9GAMM|nr:M15 family metallopeptidase [Yersinia nurmii]MDN0089341.1 M15 family metallopeptidase [Yersinia nurmii]CNE17970.1 peptidase M15 family [Yersinia nurmii]